MRSAVAFVAILFFTGASEFKPSIASQTQMQILSNQQEVIHNFQVTTLKGHTGSVARVIFSPDGKTVASESDDNMVKLWDATSGKLINTLTGHTNQVWSVIFSTRW